MAKFFIKPREFSGNIALKCGGMFIDLEDREKFLVGLGSECDFRFDKVDRPKGFNMDHIAETHFCIERNVMDPYGPIYIKVNFHGYFSNFPIIMSEFFLSTTYISNTS